MNVDSTSRLPENTIVKENSLSEESEIQNALKKLLDAYLSSPHRRRIEKIQRAYHFARRAHQGMRRYDGEPYLLHPLTVAYITVKEFGLGSTSICAALLHDVLEGTEITIDDVRVSFGDEIADIVYGMSKISGGVFGDKASLQAENFSNLLLSMSSDVRAVLVKMSDRLHNMRTLAAQRPGKQRKIANETLHIYAPLANRLGLFKIKTEFEDLAFHFLFPKEYEEIISKISESEMERKALVEEFVAPVKEKLDNAGFRYEIKARVKSVFSIYNKMVKKNVGFSEIYDIYAVRVIFDNDDDGRETLRCWEIYTYFTECYRNHPDRLRDWTNTPKSNGYRALHLTCMGPSDKWIEVQIRSRRMDEIAEMGYAAHWRYKANRDGNQTELDLWMNHIKDILANPEPDRLDQLAEIQLSNYTSEIYVFTPKGDLIKLPKGASVLDMAFAIHSELGLHCVAGKINHNLVLPSYLLSSGDQVEIITSNKQRPTPDWIHICQTAKAQNCLRPYAVPESCGAMLVNFEFIGLDRPGAIQDLLSLLGQRYNINLKGLTVLPKDNGEFVCSLTTDMPGMSQVEEMARAVMSLSGMRTYKTKRVTTHPSI